MTSRQEVAMVISQCRKKLKKLALEESKFLKIFCGHLPLIKGTVYQVETQCGKSGCRCQRGEKHKAWKITRSFEGKSQTRCIRLGDLHKYKKMARHYRQFRKARERLVKLHKEQIVLVNALEQGRRIEEIWGNQR